MSRSAEPGSAGAFREVRTDPGAISAVAIVGLIVGGLALDQFAGSYGQPVVSLMAWFALALVLVRSAPRDRHALTSCLIFATGGEIFLSLIWGIYDYRSGGIPLFVPPGHVLLYALGCRLCVIVPVRSAHAVGVAAAAAAVLCACAYGDMLSLPLTMLFLLALRHGPAPRLYATMFVLALMMELYGTWLGNWTWRGAVPWFGWSTLNPPFAAGAFYCMLDWLVGLARKRYSAGPERAAA